MFYFVLNNKEIEIINAPVINEDLSKDLDSGELTLKLNTGVKEIAPRTSFLIKNDDEVILSAIVISDEVNVMSKDNNLSYSHKISYEESVSDLKYYQARNSVFTQPSNGVATCRSSVLVPKHNLFTSASVTSDFFFTQKLSISNKAKIIKAYFDVKILKATPTDTNGAINSNISDYGLNDLSIDNETTLNKVNIYLNNNLAVYQKSVKTGDHIEINTDYIKTGYGDDNKNKITKYIFNDTDYYNATNYTKHILIATLTIEYYYYSMYDILKVLKEQTELSEE